MLTMPRALAAMLLLRCGTPSPPAASASTSPAPEAPSPCARLPLDHAADAPPPPELAPFERFAARYRAAAPGEREGIGRAFVEQRRAAGSFPLVARDGSVLFFYLGTGAEREVRVMGDFATRGPHSIQWDTAGVRLERIAPEGGAFFAQLRFEADARLDYQLLVDGVAQPDSLNPRTIESGSAPSPRASELVLPGYAIPGEVSPTPSVPKGTLIVLDEAWAEPKVTLYLPAGYDPARRYPSIYTADGKAWLGSIGLPTLLDNLTAAGRIAPALAVMIDAAEDRSAWYAYNPAYLAYLERVIAYVDSRYSTYAEPAARLHLGTSAGGRAALFAAFERPGLFGGAALLSPSLGSALYYYEPFLRGRRAPPPQLRLWLSAGSYEGSLCEDTHSLQRYLDDVGVETRATYTHEGHSFGTWRRAASGALQFLLTPPHGRR